jgi:predicted Zn finger-like uncharacterized protein
MKTSMKKLVTCPHCAAEMEISLDQGQIETGGDIVVRCPRCKQNAEFTVSRKDMAAEQTKCPFCGEEISSTAIKCKHCGEWVGRARNKDSSGARAVSRGIKQQHFSRIALKSKLLLLLGVFAFVLYVIDQIRMRLHMSMNSSQFDWLLAGIMIPLLVIGFFVALKFLRQYYDE